MTSELERIKLLRENIPKLKPRDVYFAKSLIDFWVKQRTLSVKQWKWVDVLSKPGYVTAPNQARPPDAVIEPPNSTVIEDLLHKAKKAIQFPVIRAGTSCGYKLVFRPFQQKAGAKIICNEHVIGTITRGEIYFKETGWDFTNILASISALSSNPIETARKYGKETGTCCFCARDLTDKRSVEMGYGPICAENYGLPWGAVIDNFDEANFNPEELVK